MLKIGDFSRLAQVTVKTLHHYDELGLLRPAHVDRWTGYRFYRIEQMARLNRILALKELGLSLDEVGRLLDADVSPAELRAIFETKQAELSAHIAAEQERLQRVEARLHQIEREGSLPDQEVVVKEVGEVRALCCRRILAGPQEISPFFRRIGAAMQQARTPWVGPWMALYHHGEYREYDLDVEAAIPVAAGFDGTVPLPDGGELAVRTLPAERMATVICRMTCQADVFNANQALCAWSAHTGREFASAPCREVYVEEPQPGEPVVFEIQSPLAG